MVIKDKIFEWFLKNMLIPKVNIMDNPGFMITKYSDKGKDVYLREVFLPEDLLIEIEKRIYKKYKLKGRKVLYSSGKKFGYIYASMSNFTRIDETSEKDFLSFLDFTIKYVAAIWAKKIDYEVDIEKRKLIYHLYNYIVCSKNGLGYTLTEGGIAGIWAFMTKDKSVESFQTECQGRGNDKCTLIIAPYEYLKNNNIKAEIEINVTEPKKDMNYLILNKIREPKHSFTSIKDLLDSKIFNYTEGTIEFKGKRFFDFECNLVYIIERELANVDKNNKILFDASFDFGKELANLCEEKDYKRFISNMLSALGWGDIIILNDKKGYVAISEMYPWGDEMTTKSNFVIFKGIISGMLSGFENKEIRLKKHEIKIENDMLSLIIKE